VVRLDHVALPRKQKSTQILSGSVHQAATDLIEKLKSEAHVL